MEVSPHIKKRLKIKRRGAVCVLCILMLYLSYFSGIPYRSYFDDFVAIILGIFFVWGIINGKFTKTEKIIAVLICIICAIGAVSNYNSGLVMNARYIFADAFSFVRIFLVYFGLIACLRGKNKQFSYVLTQLGDFAHIFIISAFLFAVLNLLGVVKMYVETRYGLPNYFFYFHNSSQFGVFMGCTLALLIFSNKNSLVYEIMAVLCMALTFKGMGMIIAAVYIILMLIINNKIRWWHYLMMGISLIFILQYQIVTYILDKTAPRAILIYYGFITAIRYFPLGSGFASYGSNMAAVHYSPLYYLYDFQYRKALTIFDDGNGATTFLNDTYLGMVLGQFGFWGLLLLVGALFLFGKQIFKSNTNNKKAKFIAIACFLSFCGISIMAGSIKTQIGEMLMVIFALYQLLLENDKISALESNKISNDIISE